ncbi:uncharacterized protein [Littorina saxatilis]|uniref:uncharacterized protein n=1 Tax=Littorina saxatilis TaxID=31220 RepID=UPI0038B652B5
MEDTAHFSLEPPEEQVTEQNGRSKSSPSHELCSHRHRRTLSHGHRKSCTPLLSNSSSSSILSQTSKKMFLVTALLFVLATGVSSDALPEGQLPKQGRKTFSAEKLHNMLKDLFTKQRMELWENMFDERSGGDGSGGTREDQRRHRRAVSGGVVEEVEEKVFTMEEEDRLYTFVGEMMGCQNIPGLSLGVVKKGIRQGLGYGVADMETARPVDGDTLFGIGSVTKAFAAATVTRLMVTLLPEKRFSFGTPLVDILDDFKMPDKTRTQQTTLDDVLSHRTGLGSADIGIFAGYPTNMTTKDMCSRLQFLPTMVPFRSAWYYSNTLIVLVAQLCETLAGKTWQAVVDESIFQPLQMNNTFMTNDAMSRDNAALPYILRMRSDDMFVQQDDRLFNIHPLEPAGAIMSSSKDMTKWMAYLLDVLKRPKGYEMTKLRQIFTDKILLPSYMRLLAPAVTPETILPIGYAMGFMTSYYKGMTVHWHSGDLHGYNSYLVLVPELDAAVYVAVNGPSGATTSMSVLHITYFVLELLQGQAPWVNMTLVCPDKKEDLTDPDSYEYNYDYPGDDTKDVHADAQKLLRPIEDYLGVFGHGLLGDLTIVREEERNSLLRLELGQYMVVDLIPTDQAAVFKMAARTPLADTREWEEEHTLVFKSLAPVGSSAKKSKRAAGIQDSKNGTVEEEEEEEEEEEKAPYDAVQIRWKLEVYMFKRGFHFDPSEQGGELGGEGEKEEGGEGENKVSEVAPFICKSSTAVTMFDRSVYRVVLLLLVACLAPFVKCY